MFGTFIDSFLCQLDCRNEKDAEKKSDCEEKFCKNKDEDNDDEKWENVWWHYSTDLFIRNVNKNLVLVKLFSMA